MKTLLVVFTKLGQFNEAENYWLIIFPPILKKGYIVFLLAFSVVAENSEAKIAIKSFSTNPIFLNAYRFFLVIIEKNVLARYA